MYKKGAGNDKQGKDAGNRTLCPYRNFSQAIMIMCVSNVRNRRDKGGEENILLPRLQLTLTNNI